ncbi:hypothetical protein O6H91_12G072200 [Diphasiastrum complanatum]|uniref:Uncharacterized protein n=1 Tax=Diphasiastrum complanatum TaxID=34168 RepID=A0ACC2C3F1_DIPCM|nr:hypothetical protein O6H91_12G072200 [Diphasiastrum complanatum]
MHAWLSIALLFTMPLLLIPVLCMFCYCTASLTSRCLHHQQQQQQHGHRHRRLYFSRLKALHFVIASVWSLSRSQLLCGSLSQIESLVRWASSTGSDLLLQYGMSERTDRLIM